MKHQIWRVFVTSTLIALCATGCSAFAQPTPAPTATPNIEAMVAAAIDAMLKTAPPPQQGPTSTPKPMLVTTPTSTTRPTDTPVIATLAPTPTPVPKRLQEVPCSPNCDIEYEPPWGYVEWMQGPSVSLSGVLTLTARIDERIDFITPDDDGGYDNISLSTRSATGGTNPLYGSIVPPGPNWVPEPGLWAASEYRYSNGTLTVRAQVDPAAATHHGLRLCLWSGGTREQNQLLDCKAIQQP